MHRYRSLGILVSRPGHVVLTERCLLHLKDLCDDGLLVGIVRSTLDVPDDERNLHDVVHG
jgi:hypothetical protein